MGNTLSNSGIQPSNNDTNQITANYTPANQSTGDSTISDSVASGMNQAGSYLAGLGSEVGGGLAQGASRVGAAMGVAPSADGQYHAGDIAQNVGEKLVSTIASRHGNGSSSAGNNASSSSATVTPSNSSSNSNDGSGNVRAKSGTSNVPEAMRQPSSQPVQPVVSPTPLLSFSDAFNNNLTQKA